MSPSHAPRRRVAFATVAGAVLLMAFATTTPASATGRGEVICDLAIGSTQFRQHGHWTFDSAIPAGLVVTVGDPVELAPFTGELELNRVRGHPRRERVVSVEGDGVVSARVAETGDRLEIPFHVGPTAVGQSPGFTPAVTGGAGTIVPTVAGTHTLLAQGYELTLVTDPAGPDATVTCDSLDDPAESFDSFVATAGANPTESPVRPVLVQTDFAGEDHLDGPAAGARWRAPWPSAPARSPRVALAPAPPRADTEVVPVPVPTPHGRRVAPRGRRLGGARPPRGVRGRSATPTRERDAGPGTPSPTATSATSPTPSPTAATSATGGARPPAGEPEAGHRHRPGRCRAGRREAGAGGPGRQGHPRPARGRRRLVRREGLADAGPSRGVDPRRAHQHPGHRPRHLRKLPQVRPGARVRSPTPPATRSTSW